MSDDLKISIAAMDFFLDWLDADMPEDVKWKAAQDIDGRDLFRDIFKLHDYEVHRNRPIPTKECASFRMDTVPGLYRLLYLCKPKRVDFSDMYKSNSLFALLSPDAKFVADIQFYKYELAAYISASPEHIDGREHAILCGVPGSDNGISVKDELLKAWVSLLERSLKTKWPVYLGNNFEV